MAQELSTTTRPAELIGEFQRIRARTERIAESLSAEDQALQSMPECSPTKWHRAHTTWFFETFVLEPFGIAPHQAAWKVLFNSYYAALGPRLERGKRGLLSRPTAAEVTDYRRTVDGRVTALLEGLDSRQVHSIRDIVRLGIAHEEQHQELVLTDIRHAFAENPLAPRYANVPMRPAGTARPLTFSSFDGGLVEVGAPANGFFSFDNEGPRHKALLGPFQLADRLLTVAEWRAFADAGAYDAPEFWLSDGFDWAQANHVRAPLYTRREGDKLVAFELGGMRQLEDCEPVVHLSYYEADALARFLGARLPTEEEWETAARASGHSAAVGNFLDDGPLPPAPAAKGPLAQLFGDAWEWTSSAYGPYPGFRVPKGAIGEYNGKFMVNQLVLRGGSCFTPRGHVRPSYRNFWSPSTRFQVTGVRLAKTVAT